MTCYKLKGYPKVARRSNDRNDKKMQPEKAKVFKQGVPIFSKLCVGLFTIMTALFHQIVSIKANGFYSKAPSLNQTPCTCFRSRVGSKMS